MLLRIKIFLRSSFIVIALTLLLIISIEIVSAISYYAATGAIVKHPLFSNQSIYNRKNYDSYEFSPYSIFVNKQGTRQKDLYAKKEISLPPKTEKTRIFIVGGSTVANERKPPGDRIADHIQKTLEAKGINAEVFNFGVPSYTSLNELYLILSTLIYYAPDLVISYNGANDAYYGSVLSATSWRQNATETNINFDRRMAKVYAMPPVERLRYTLEAYSYSYYWINRLFQANAAIDFDEMSPEEFSEYCDRQTEKRTEIDPVLYAKRLQRPSIYSDQAVLNEAAIDTYINNMQFTAASLGALNIKFLHVLQPTALNKSHLYPREGWSIEFNNAYYRDFQSVMLHTLRSFSDRLRRIATQKPNRQTRFLDLSAFTDTVDEYLFDDYCHAYKHGRLTALVGEKIGNFIAEEMLKPAREAH